MRLSCSKSVYRCAVACAAAGMLYLAFSLAGCGGNSGHVLGAAPAGDVVQVAAIQSAAPGTPVLARGKMVER